jgi:hypothetical protein
VLQLLQLDARPLAVGKVDVMSLVVETQGALLSDIAILLLQSLVIVRVVGLLLRARLLAPGEGLVGGSEVRWRWRRWCWWSRMGEGLLIDIPV